MISGANDILPIRESLVEDLPESANRSLLYRKTIHNILLFKRKYSSFMLLWSQEQTSKKPSTSK